MAFKFSYHLLGVLWFYCFQNDVGLS